MTVLTTVAVEMLVSVADRDLSDYSLLLKYGQISVDRSETYIRQDQTNVFVYPGGGRMTLRGTKHI